MHSFIDISKSTLRGMTELPSLTLNSISIIFIEKKKHIRTEKVESNLKMSSKERGYGWVRDETLPQVAPHDVHPAHHELISPCLGSNHGPMTRRYLDKWNRYSWSRIYIYMIMRAWPSACILTWSLYSYDRRRFVAGQPPTYGSGSRLIIFFGFTRDQLSRDQLLDLLLVIIVICFFPNPWL